MSIFETYTQRLKRQQATEAAEVYTYDTLPQPLRVQIVQICRDALGVSERYAPDEVEDRWNLIFRTFIREKGVFSLSNNVSREDLQCMQFLLTADLDDTLDLIDLTFRVINLIQLDRNSSTSECQRRGVGVPPDLAIEELNHRFQQHGVGYSFVEGRLFRVDNFYTHTEITKTALSLLSDARFEKTNQEFRLAHQHHRQGEV